MLISINISYMQKFINGDTVLQILIPLGAILFLCLKRRLIESASIWNEKQEMRAALQQEPEQLQKDADVE